MCRIVQQWCCFLLLIWLLPESDSAKILTVAPMISRSHFILGYKMSRALADDGHDVTVLSSFNDEYNSTKGSYKSIQITGLSEEIKKIDFFSMGGINPFLMMTLFMFKTNGKIEKALSHPNVQQLIKSDEKFDIVLIEQFSFEAMRALAPHFGAHLMVYSAAGQGHFIDPYVGAPTLPSYAPESLLGYTGDMTFFERVQNTLLKTLTVLIRELYTHPSNNRLVHKYISPDINLYDVLYNISVAFVNTHISVAPALPISPNMVFVGGFHMDDPKPLPKDLKEILDNSKNGVVFFSMGNVLQSKNMPTDKRDAILNVLKGLKETVLWKYEDNTLPNIPDNVHIMKWLPQIDLLAHPNLKLFITHGGYGSTTEAIYHGKPVVAMPVMADQHLNAQTLEQFGVGKAMAFKDFTEDRFRSIVSEVLNNPKYAQKAKGLSELYRDRQAKPLEEVLYWVNYVIRHNGAKHLRSVMLDLPWYKLYLLDVLLFFLVISFGFIFVLKKLVCKLRRKSCCRSSKKEKTN